MARGKKEKADRGRSSAVKLWQEAIKLWDETPKNRKGLLVALEEATAEFWRTAETDASLELEQFLLEVAGRIRRGQSDACERMLVSRLIERQLKRPLPKNEEATRRASHIATFVYAHERGQTHDAKPTVKREAAVAAAMESFKCGRRTVFAALKAAKKEAALLLEDALQRPRWS